MRRIDVLFRKHGVEDELDDEIRFHLEREIELLRAGGLSEAEARRRALVAFGGVERYKEEVRDVRGARVVDDLVRDLQIAARSFVKQPMFLATVLLTLGLAIGGNVAMFGILEASLFRALPYAEPDRLVLGRVMRGGQPGNTVSGPDYFDVREQASTFESLSAFTPFSPEATVTGAGDAERVRSPYGSWDLFLTLGVDPEAGRHFLAEEGEPGAESVAMLSHGYWQRGFGADPSVVGGTIDLDGQPTTVVGVLPEGFRFPIAADVWRPMIRDGAFAQSRQFHNFVMIGRLAPAVELSAARAEVDAITARLAELHPDTNRDKGMYLEPLHAALVESYRTMLGVLAASVLALLLIACANVGGILLARGSARGAEMAVRSVMGAGHGRLVRQLLAENLLLAVGATALGLFMAGTVQRGLLSFVSLEGLGGVEPGWSAGTAAAASGLALLTLALFGLFPALRTARSEPAAELAAGGARSGGSREAAGFRSALVVAQVTLTVVLLMVSGLLVRSMGELRGVDIGFDPEGLLTAETPLPAAKYEDVLRRPALFIELQRRLEALPGVRGVGIASGLPIRDPGNNVNISPIESWGDDGATRTAYQRMVLPGYFDAMGVQLLAGRDVALDDERAPSGVVVLSESLAAALFPDGAPLGRVVGVDIGGAEPWPAEVVGVVGDVAPSGLAQGKDVTMYFAYTQRSPASMRIAVRTAGDPMALVPGIREALRTLDPDVPLAEVATMEQVLAESVSDRRAVMLVIVVFALVALLLSTVGVYGVLAYQVTRRAREIGVRMALGASVVSVSREVVGKGLRLVAIGLVLGIPASVLAARLVRGMLFEVSVADPLTYAAVSVFLAGVASVACLLPARRAAKVDPARAFRAE
jgi:putative ABC transport system permease protein